MTRRHSPGAAGRRVLQSIPRVLVATLYLVCFAEPIAAGDSIQVPSDYATIQDAIVAAQPGQEILVAPGIYVENLDFLGKGITVKSTEGPGVTTIDGSSGLVVRIASVESTEATIAGFTIRNGALGILVSDSAATIRDNVLTEHVAGAIRCEPTSTVQILDNEICGNNGSSWGVIDTLGGETKIIGNLISENSSFFRIIRINNGSALLRNNTIIYNENRTIDFFNTGDVQIVQNLFAFNNGAIHWSVPSVADVGPQVISNTFVLTPQPSGGGAISAQGFDADARIVNNVFSSETIHSLVHCDDGSQLPFIGFNLFHTPQGSATSGGCEGFENLNGNLIGDPLFIDALEGDFRLLPGSPAIDAGTNDEPGTPELDFDGDPRSCGPIDLGIDEYFDPGLCQPFLRGDANTDGTIAINDPIRILDVLFHSAASVCFKAQDVDDGGVVDMGDAIQLIGYLFRMSTPPAAPFPVCSNDPTDDSLTCDEYSCP